MQQVLVTLSEEELVWEIQSNMAPSVFLLF